MINEGETTRQKKKNWGNFDPRKNKGGNDYLGSKIFFVLPFIMIVLNGNRFFFSPLRQIYYTYQ